MDIFDLELWHVLVTFILGWVIVKWVIRSGVQLPPQIPGIPFLGNLNEFQCLSTRISELSKKYGDIFTLSLLGKKIVVVNKTEILQELYTSTGEDLLNKPNANYTLKTALYNTQGVLFRPWSPTVKHLRRITTHAIMMVGEQRKQVETLIQEEAESLVDILDESEGEGVNLLDELQASLSNVICVLVIGKRFSRDDPDSNTLLTCVNLMNEIGDTGFGWELDMFPFLRWLPIKSTNTIKQMITLRDQFIDKYYTQLKETFQKDSLRCMTDHMINSMYENPDGDVTEDVIKAVVLDMLAAGAVTTSSALGAALAILVTHQNIQKQIHDELDQVVGHSQVANMSHKGDMHYLQAFILEVLRYVTVTLSSRSAYRDTSIRGYCIPKGTMVVFNLFGSHHDPHVWKDPYTVDPNRFLDENGHLVPANHPNRKRLLPFGGGKRVCVGEVFAKNRIYLFLSILLQRFRFLPVDGAPLPVDDPRKFIPATVLKPPPFKTRIIRRE